MTSQIDHFYIRYSIKYSKLCRKVHNEFGLLLEFQSHLKYTRIGCRWAQHDCLSSTRIIINNLIIVLPFRPVNL